MLDRDTFLRQIVSRDEKWILYSNPHEKKQWLTSGLTPKLGLYSVTVSMVGFHVSIVQYEVLNSNDPIIIEYL